MKKSLYEYLLQENTELLKRIFLEKQKNNIGGARKLMEKLKENMNFLELLENNVSRETLESEIIKIR